MHPTASIDYRIRARARTRVHVEPHPVLADHVLLTFGHGDADVEISLDAANAESLITGVADLLARFAVARESGQVTA